MVYKYFLLLNPYRYSKWLSFTVLFSLSLVKPLQAKEIYVTEVSEKSNTAVSKAIRLKTAIEKSTSLRANSNVQTLDRDILFRYPQTISQTSQISQSLSQQDNTRPPSNQPIPQQNIPALPPPEELLEPNGIPSTPETIPPTQIPQTILVNKIEIKGSTVFSQEEFAKITKDYINKPITFAELLQLRSRITQLYLDEGYITSGAYIQTRDLKTAQLKLKS